MLIRVLLINLKPQRGLMHVDIVLHLLGILVLDVRRRRLHGGHRRPNCRPPTSLISIVRLVIVVVTEPTHHRIRVVARIVLAVAVMGLQRRWRRRVGLIRSPGRWCSIRGCGIGLWVVARRRRGGRRRSLRQRRWRRRGWWRRRERWWV